MKRSASRSEESSDLFRVMPGVHETGGKRESSVVSIAIQVGGSLSVDGTRPDRAPLG
jgi:hypothetical protein